jgi:hypothetical protein
MNNKEFKNISCLLRSLSFEYESSKDEFLAGLQSTISMGYIDLNQLKSELDFALKSESFDWIEMAIDNKFIWEQHLYTDKDVVADLKYNVWDFLFPEESFSKSQIKKFQKDLLEILANSKHDIGWETQSRIFKILKNKLDYEKLEYHHFLYIEEFINKDEILRGSNYFIDEFGYFRHNYSYKLVSGRIV